MKTFKVLMYGREVELYIKRFQYAYPQNTMIQLNEIGGEPYASLTTNPSFKLPNDIVAICMSNYSPIVTAMVQLHILELQDGYYRSGFNTYNYFKINEEFIKQYEVEL